MGNLAITSSQFKEEVLNSSVPVLVDFWAPWCGPCKAISPFVEEMATEYAGKAKVVKVDVDNEPELSSEYNVMTIPTLLIFKDGKVVDRMNTAAPKAQLTAFLDRNI